MKPTDREAADAHFSVDKQNISLWPREPAAAPRKPLSVRVGIACLVLVLVALVLLQSVLYPMLIGTISGMKTDARVLSGRVDNISALSPGLQKNSDRLEATRLQVRAVNASLGRVRGQILTLKSSMSLIDAQIQALTSHWEEAEALNARIPELKRDLDKASALNAKIQGLQGKLEEMGKLLQAQDDILQMVSQGWKYFKENFYYFSRIPKTWYSAQQFCVSRKSSLTSVTSEQEQEFLYKTADGIPHWIGLTKAGSEGNWYWADGTLFTKEQFWMPGEPNNVGNNEHCVDITVSSLQSWNDNPCDNKLLFICKRPYTPSHP